MASCEKCHTRDIPFTEMRTSEVDGEKLLVGPCCAEEGLPPAFDYHFEASSKNGVLASVGYGGLRLEYKKTPEQLRRSFKQVPAERQPEVEVH